MGIIMKNGVRYAGGGTSENSEGHPTNANEITFNNKDTDLVSEDVESAIKEVNAKFDRGSVSVTADGVKSWGEIFHDLITTADISKITRNSVLEIGTSVMRVERIESNKAIYGDSGVTSGEVRTGVAVLDLTANNCKMYNTRIASDSTVTYSNDTSAIMTSGRVCTLYY